MMPPIRDLSRNWKFLKPISVALALAGCAAGGSSESPNAGMLPSTAPAASTDRLCTDGARRTVGPYMIENNLWNKRDATRYSQCVSLTDAGKGAVTAVLDWSWTVKPDGIRAYPELIYGQKPWNASTTPALPRVIDSLQAVSVGTGFTQTRDAAANGNLAFDIWLTSSNQRPAGSDHLPIKVELMIWLDAFGGAVPAGAVIGSVDIGGTTWDVYRTTATWGPEPWLYVAYKARSLPASPLQLDVLAFLRNLKQRGSITGQEWLASIEVGNEIVAGKGTTTFSNFSVSVK